MLYISKININANTARAKHIRSLIQANDYINRPLKFVFFNYKKPNIGVLIFLKSIIKAIFKEDIVYTRDIEFAIICSFLNIKVVLEIHQFGMIRKTTKNFILNRYGLFFLSKSKFVKFVTLTKDSARVLRNLYPSLLKNRIFIIPDAGGFIYKNYLYLKKDNCRKNKKINISYAGSLLPGKGGLETICLAKGLSQYQFNIAGNLSDDLIEEVSQVDNINFFGYLNDNEIIEFYSSSDILIAPIGARIFLDKKLKNEITFYTSPLKIYEYLITNKPIIAIDRPCLRLFKNIPGIWLINKKEAFNLNTWKSTIKMAYLESQKSNYDYLLKARNNYLYNWEKRINDMVMIK